MKKFLRNKLSIMTVLVMTSLSLAACNDDNDSTNTTPVVENPGEVTPPSEATQTNIISGKLVSYDGQTPIANALVYITDQANGTNSKIVANVYNTSSLIIEAKNTSNSSSTTECGTAPQGSLASTCTNADGSYELSIETDNRELLIKFEKGAFSAEQNITLQENGSSQAEVTELNDTVLENVPNMVVIEGYYDSIENILVKLGLASIDTQSGEIIDAKFDLWNTANNLFIDSDNDGKADIYNYEIVFFNCGQKDKSWLMDDGKRHILKDYINNGGRIYVSDQAYNIVEQTFPEYIDFYGSDNTPVDQPEQINAAYEGESGITIQSNIEPKLKSWLEGVTCTSGSCLNADGTVTINGFLSGWAKMNSVSSSKDVDIYASGQDSDQMLRPLTVAFNYGKGRVTYTSYHNEEDIEVMNDELHAQQRILQYLVFEL